MFCYPIRPATCLALLGILAGSPAPSSEQSVGSGTVESPADAWSLEFRDPPTEYTLIPFWFWNDELSEGEIVRQIDDFVAHGVHGFVIHPRIGLPEDTGFMSERFVRFVRVAVDHASRRGMIVHLYDEGMYPSGSACGLVVQENPAFAARCLLAREIPEGSQVELAPEETLVTVQTLPDGRRVAFVDAPSLGKIRGVHFGQDDGEPNQPRAGDLLNPQAVACFIRLVHERYYEALKEHFGASVRAVFTDEPSMLGRGHRRGAQPWTTGLEAELERLLGYDIRPHLPKLWYDLGDGTEDFRRSFQRAVLARLEETYYEPLSRWCGAHGVALTGHPAKPDDLGLLRHFQLPGQDVVWRYLEPGKPSALEGAQSTMGKCSSSAAIHLGRTRNGNEAFGAYGWSFTYDEMRWVTDWLLVRGVDLLWPHAFYYSLRGKRRDERPPDVGPNSAWWSSYKEYAGYVRRGCWLLSSGTHRASVAVLGRSDSLPFGAAKVLFQAQRDFNYLEDRLLRDGTARVGDDGIRVGPMRYRVLVIDDRIGLDPAVARALAPLASKGGLLRYAGATAPSTLQAEHADGPEALVRSIDSRIQPDLQIEPGNADLRYRRVSHPGRDVYLLFNEGESTVKGMLRFGVPGHRYFLARLEDGVQHPVDYPVPLNLASHETTVIVVELPKS